MGIIEFFYRQQQEFEHPSVVLESPYRCPRKDCRSEQTQGDGYEEADDNMVTQEMHCTNCNAEWLLVWHIADYDIIAIGDNPTVRRKVNVH